MTPWSTLPAERGPAYVRPTAGRRPRPDSGGEAPDNTRLSARAGYAASAQPARPEHIDEAV